MSNFLVIFRILKFVISLGLPNFSGQLFFWSQKLMSQPKIIVKEQKLLSKIRNYCQDKNVDLHSPTHSSRDGRFQCHIACCLRISKATTAHQQAETPTTKNYCQDEKLLSRRKIIVRWKIIVLAIIFVTKKGNQGLAGCADPFLR